MYDAALSDLVRSDLTLSYLIESNRIVSCLVLSCLVNSRYSYPTSYHIISYHIMSCHHICHTLYLSAPESHLVCVPLPRAVLCCAVLCCAVLCCAVLCCAVLCCVCPLLSGVNLSTLPSFTVFFSFVVSSCLLISNDLLSHVSSYRLPFGTVTFLTLH
jgi:hypothetical protein